MSEEANVEQAAAEAEAAVKALEEAKRKAETIKLQADIKKFNNTIKKLEKSNKTLTDEAKRAKDALEKAKITIKAADGDLANLKIENENLTKQLEDTTKKLAEKPKEIVKEVINNEEIDKLNAEIVEFKKRIQLDDDQIESYEIRYEEVMKQLEEKPKVIKGGSGKVFVKRTPKAERELGKLGIYKAYCCFSCQQYIDNKCGLKDLETDPDDTCNKIQLRC